MSLILEVVGEKAARMGSSARKTFTSGGTIGRLADNDWIFPDEYISGHHAKISFTNGAFLIEDTSTNGVFINSPQNRLTRNKPYPLRSGDTLFIDDYEVRVTLGAEPAAVESYAPVRRGGSIAPSAPDEAFFDGAPGASGVPNATDPLALLGLQSPPAIRPGPSAASLQNQSALAQHYRPPTATPPPAPVQVAPLTPKSPPPGFIPDDYDPMGAEEDPFASPPDPPPPASRPAQAMPPPPSPPPVRPAVAPSTRAVAAPPSAAASTVLTGPPRVPKPGSRPATVEPRAAQPNPSARDAGRGAQAPINSDPFEASDSAARLQRNSSQERSPPPVAPASPVPPVRPKAPPPQANPVVPPSPAASQSRAAPARGAGEMDFAAMLKAAGLNDVHVTPELSQQFGQILRVVVAGLMDVLQARNKIKDEFRMRMTTYKQADNNPLKFSVNVEDALHNLLVKRNAAYLGPVEAFEDAFLDVRNHQMAMLAGVRVAYEAMLAEFDPDRLQKDFDPVAKSANFLAGAPKAKYWELYRNRFHDMVKDADSSFRHLFGDDFAKAYEEQLARLKAANRAERK
jgi:type VI secretion system FHA domain protein